MCKTNARVAATKTQIANIANLLNKAVQDPRFQAQGYFIVDTDNIGRLEASVIIDYLTGRKNKMPSMFNEYVSFDNGWNTAFIRAAGLREVENAMLPMYIEAVNKGELSLEDALSDVDELRDERKHKVEIMINGLKL